MNIPYTTFRSVIHVGQLEGAVGEHSFEGSCLSVSRCPHAWTLIACLGGKPWHQLTHPTGTFVDMHALYLDKPLSAHIAEWGVANGYAQRTEAYRSWFFDDDTQEWRFFLFSTADDAFREADAMGTADSAADLEGPNGRGTAVEPVELWIATPKLSDRMGFTLRATEDAFDFIVLAWAEDTQPEVQGLWWADQYAPASLSAPRGGIFPSRLAQWKVTPLAIGSVRDSNS